jgi:hypothetical protein
MVRGTLAAVLLLMLPSEATAQAYHHKHGFKWQEKDGQIIGESVCFDKTESLAERLDCRRYARQYFRKKCRDIERQVRRQKIKETKRQRADRKKFCGVGIP